MNVDCLMRQLSESDFYIDTNGRVVISNPDVMNEINGASGMHMQPGIANGACYNAACR